MLWGEEGCLQVGPGRDGPESDKRGDKRGDERSMGGAGRRGRLADSTAGLSSCPLKAPERAAMDRGGDQGQAQETEKCCLPPRLSQQCLRLFYCLTWSCPLSYLVPPPQLGEKDSGRRTPCFRYLRDRLSGHS